MTSADLEAAFGSKKWVWEVHQEAFGEPARLIAFLSSKLPHIDGADWPLRLAQGGTYINGLPVAADTVLRAPCKVEFYEPKVAARKLAASFASIDECRCVFEDRYLAVYFKPARLPCMPAKDQQAYNLKRYVESIYGTQIHMPSRLDMSTQGLVLFSKCRRSHRALQLAFEQRRVEKRYLLRVEGAPYWRFKFVCAAIGKSPNHPVLRQVGGTLSKPAQTIFRASDPTSKTTERSSYSTLVARPVSGRTHQIRVHAGQIGYPIVGDKFYGGAVAPQLNLLSYSLQFRHPIDGGCLRIKTPVELLPEWLDKEDLCRLQANFLV